MAIHRRARGPGRSDWPACPTRRGLSSGRPGRSSQPRSFSSSLSGRQTPTGMNKFTVPLPLSRGAVYRWPGPRHRSRVNLHTASARAAPATAAGPRSPKSAEERECLPGELVHNWSRGIGASIYGQQQQNLLGGGRRLDGRTRRRRRASSWTSSSPDYGQGHGSTKLCMEGFRITSSTSRAYCARWEDRRKAARCEVVGWFA